jgi:hypothetical protein
LSGSQDHASLLTMMNRGFVAGLGLLLAAGCASGPHPALEVASRDLDCPIKDLKRHEIYPNKQRVEGCNKEGIYVKDCGGYGVDSQCRWARATEEY